MKLGKDAKCYFFLEWETRQLLIFLSFLLFLSFTPRFLIYFRRVDIIQLTIRREFVNYDPRLFLRLLRDVTANFVLLLSH